MNKENKAAYRREQRFQRKLLAYWQQQTPFVFQPSSPALKPHPLTFIYLLSQICMPTNTTPDRAIETALLLSVCHQSGFFQLPKSNTTTLVETTQSTSAITVAQTTVRNINYHSGRVMLQYTRRSRHRARQKNKSKSKIKNKTKTATPDISHILKDTLTAVSPAAVKKYGWKKALTMRAQLQQQIFTMIKDLREKSPRDQQWIDTALMSPGFQFVFDTADSIQTHLYQGTRGLYISIDHAIVLPLEMDLTDNEYF